MRHDNNENNNKTIDNWIKVFSENGLIIEKEMKKVKYLIIENGKR